MVCATLRAEGAESPDAGAAGQGNREALFAFGQAVIDPTRLNPTVVSPNPFYQICEGAALLAGAEPLSLNQTDDNGFALDLDSLSEGQWARTQLLYLCSPANPSGRVLTLDEWRALFEQSDRYGFVIASDECISQRGPEVACPRLRRATRGSVPAMHSRVTP
jgi:N-succinyldiaminopimelate aminotransferase